MGSLSDKPANVLEGSASRRRAALENLAFGWATAVFTVVQGLVLVPFILRCVPVDLYGAWLASGNILGWIELADPGLSPVLQRQLAYSTGQGDRLAVGRLIGTGLTLSALLAIVPLSFIPLAGHAADLLHLETTLAEALVPAVVVGLVSVAVGMVGNAVGAMNLGIQRIRSAGISNLAGMVVGIAVTVAILAMGGGLIALPAGTLSRSGTALLVNLATLVLGNRRAGVQAAWSSAEGKALIGLAGYTFLGRITAVMLTRVDAILCARMVSPAAVVTLTLTGRTIEVVRLVTDRVGIAVMPVLAHLAGERTNQAAGRAILALARGTAALVAVLAGVAVAWNGPAMELWVGPSHFGGLGLTVLLAIASAMGALAALLGQGLLAVGGIKEASIIGMTEAAVRLVLVFVMIPLVGLAGVPLATIAAGLALTVLLVPRSYARRCGLPVGSLYWNYGRAAATMGGGILAGAALALLPAVHSNPGWLKLGLLASLTGVALSGLALLADGQVRAQVRALARRH